MKKKIFAILMVLTFTVITPCTTYAVTREEVEQIMHTLLPGSKSITTAPFSFSNSSSQDVRSSSTVGQEQDAASPSVTSGISQQNPSVNSAAESLDNQGRVEAPAATKNHDLTRQEVFLTCLNKMGWTYTLSLFKRLSRLQEFSQFSPIDFVSNNMKPAPPQGLFTPTNEPFPESDLTKLKNWISSCVKNVSIEANIALKGSTLYVIKRGVPTSSGDVQDLEAQNVPLFIACYYHNPKKNSASVTRAQQFGSDKLPLATIASSVQGADFAINGGYFGAEKGQIVGVLRSNGKIVKKDFCPNRSGFAWNNKGEHIFFDARTTQNIVGNPAFDKYTEAFQAGPMLIFNGETTQSTEDIYKNVLSKRHPRSFVAELADGTLIWGEVDGRDAIHSVGMTIDELRAFCKERHFINALNLDGGGSSSVWWHGITFSKPCNKLASEMHIPYAVVICNEETTAQQLNIAQKKPTPAVTNTIVVPHTDHYMIEDTIGMPNHTPAPTEQPQQMQQPQEQPQEEPHVNSILQKYNDRNKTNNSIVLPQN